MLVDATAKCRPGLGPGMDGSGTAAVGWLAILGTRQRFYYYGSGWHERCCSSDHRIDTLRLAHHVVNSSRHPVDLGRRVY
jgi:hypothetical protein